MSVLALGPIGVPALEQYKIAVASMRNDLVFGAHEARNIGSAIDTTIKNYKAADATAVDILMTDTGLLNAQIQSPEGEISQANSDLADSLSAAPSMSGESMASVATKAMAVRYGLSGAVRGVAAIAQISPAASANAANIAKTTGTTVSTSKEAGKLTVTAALAGAAALSMWATDSHSVARARDGFAQLASDLSGMFAHGNSPDSLLYQHITNAWSGTASDQAAGRILDFITAGVELRDRALLYADTLGRLLSDLSNIYTAIMILAGAQLAGLLLLWMTSLVSPSTIFLMKLIGLALSYGVIAGAASAGTILYFYAAKLSEKPTAQYAPAIDFQSQ